MTERLAGRTADSYAPLLPRVDGAYLDCVSDDLALLLAAYGLSDVRTPFAQDWRFDLAELGSGPARIDLPPADQDDLLSQRTGWRPRWRPVTSVERDAGEWQRSLGAGEPVLLVGDAFCLPWLPYSGQEHMDHGFVLTGLGADDRADRSADDLIAYIADPYDNVTEWGAAKPVTTQLPLTALIPALTGGRWAVLMAAAAAAPIPPEAQIAANATAILEAGAAAATSASSPIIRGPS